VIESSTPVKRLEVPSCAHSLNAQRVAIDRGSSSEPGGELGAGTEPIRLFETGFAHVEQKTVVPIAARAATVRIGSSSTKGISAARPTTPFMGKVGPSP
jgi:hypothetical protein